MCGVTGSIYICIALTVVVITSRVYAEEFVNFLQGSHSFTDKKLQDFPRPAGKIVRDLFWSPQMF